MEAVGGAEGVVPGVVDVVAVDVFGEVEVPVPEGVDVPGEVEVLVVVAGGAEVPDVDAAGGELVMGAATGFFMAAECTGRRCCPFGPVADATAPKLRVAASAAAAPSRRYVRGTCRIVPLPAPGVGPLGRELRDDRDFGGSANSESPVALRPPLARGLPFSTVFNRDLDGFIPTSQRIRSYQRLLQPTGNRFTTQTWSQVAIGPKDTQPLAGVRSTEMWVPLRNSDEMRTVATWSYRGRTVARTQSPSIHNTHASTFTLAITTIKARTPAACYVVRSQCATSCTSPLSTS